MATTFSGFCIAACVFIIFFDFGLAFVSTTGAFETGVVTPINVTGNSTVDFGRFFSSGFTNIWLGLLGLSLGSLAICAIASVSPNIIAVILFGEFFWTGWLNVISVLNTGGFFGSSTGIVLMSMLSVGMMIMFVGAVIGMLSGNPMRS